MKNEKGLPAGRQGFALLAAIFVIIVFAILGIVAVSLMSGENILAVRDYQSLRAFRLAEAGLHYTIAASLSADSDWRDNTGFSKNLSPGSFSVDYLYKARKYCILSVTGEVSGIKRSVTVTLRRGKPSPFDYGIYASNPESETLYIQNSATVYGDLYYNGHVVMEAQSDIINGTAYVIPPLDDDACQNKPIPWEAIEVIDPPSFESTYYDNLLAMTSTPTTQAWNSSDTLALDGGDKYYTNVNIQNGGVVTGPGRLIVTEGDFSVQNGGKVSDKVTVVVSGEASFGGGVNDQIMGADLIIISKGEIDIGNKVQIPRDAILFSKNNDIKLGQSVIIWGSTLAPDGKVDSGNQSATINGIMYGKYIDLGQASQLFGSAIVTQVGVFKNSATVTYDPAKFPAVFPPGFNIDTSEVVAILNWQENF